MKYQYLSRLRRAVPLVVVLGLFMALFTGAPSAFASNCSVTYSAGAGSGSVPTDSTTYTCGTDSVTVQGQGGVSRPGYTFAGWASGGGLGPGPTYQPGASFTINADTSLTALWNAVTFSVTYSGNGNTGGAPPTDGAGYVLNATVTVLGQNGMLRTGYTFGGWATGGGASPLVTYQPGATFSIQGNTTLTAVWNQVATFTMTYNGLGSTGGAPPVDPNTYASGATVTVLGAGTLVKAGYSFGGWTDCVINHLYGATFTILGNTVVCPVWTINPYAVHYLATGSTSGTPPSDPNSPYVSGATVTVLGQSTLLKTGYHFGGWKDFDTQIIFGATFVIVTSHDLLPVWIPDGPQTVTFNSNYGTATITTQSSATLANLTANTFTRSGYTFTGWNTDPAGGGSGTPYANQASYSFATPITLYAQWVSIPTFTVIYAGNCSNSCGAVPIDSTHYLANASVTVGAAPGSNYSGFHFSGWAYGGLAVYQPGQSFTITSNTTLTAVWVANVTYTVTYFPFQTTSGTPPVDILSPYSSGDVVFVLGAGTLLKTGYTFNGWGNCPAITTVGTSFVIHGDTTLCSLWIANPKFKVTYNGNGNSGGAVPAQTIGSGVVTLATNTGSLVKSGSTFGGWNTKANGSGIPYAVGSSYNLIADITLYAVWVPAQVIYRITYDGNGNSGGSAPNPTTGAGSVLLATNSGSLVKSSNHLGGWNTKADGSGVTYPLGASYNLIANITLYALWLPNTYTITYDGNGATGGVVPNPTVGSGPVTLAYNSGALVKSGNSYNNWNTAADGSGTAYLVGSSYTLNADLTLYAIWVPKTFTVTYNGNGFTGGTSPIDPTAYFSGGTVVVLGPNTLVKTGFTFGGWALGGLVIYTPGQTFPITSDVTLTAVWTPNIIYTITYNGNGFSGGAVPNPTVGSGPVTLATNSGSLVKSGSSFGGWNTAIDGSGTPYAVGSPYTLNADITLYAVWFTGINSYTVTYAGNGSTGGSVPSPTVGSGSVILATNSGSLVKSGSTFSGWNTKVDGSGTPYGVGSNYNLIADITLYAVWIPVVNVYTITYSGNGYTGGAAPSPTVGSGSVTLATNSGSLSKSSYTFGGWNTASNGSGTPYAVGSNYTLLADITLYAVWSPINILYTVTYLGNSNTGGVAPHTTVGLGSVTLATNSGPLVKSGSTFGGWNTSASGTGTPYSVASNYTLAADVTLYAMWSGGNTLYTVTYAGNGSTGGVAPVPTLGIGSVTLASNGGLLTRSGYLFGGWNLKADGSGTPYPLSGNYNLIANVTMYALWTPYTPFTITYLGNSNTSGSVPAPTVGSGLVKLAENTGGLSRTGYTFGGWNTKANNSGTSYLVGSTYDLNANITLYAIFIGAPIVEIPPDLIANGKIVVTAPQKKIALNQIVPVHQKFLTVLPSSAIGFELYENGKFIARGTTNSYDLQQIVGPKDLVKVQSVGKDGLKSPQTAVTLSKDPISLANINFNTDSYKFIGPATKILDQVAAVIIQHGYTVLEIWGYVDTQGSKASWITLSNNRAKAVKDYMTIKLKGTGVTIKNAGRAQTQAVGNNNTAAGRALNRRVEIRVS